MSDTMDTQYQPRLCHILKWPDFQGYGFNLHAEKGKAGQFIGKVDDDSPASSAGLKSGDRIVEVNGVNIGNENHQQVVQRVKAGGEQTRLLVVDDETDQHYKNEKKVVKGDLPEVSHKRTELRAGQDEPPSMPVTETVHTVETVSNVEITPEPVDNNNVTDEYQPRLCHIRKWHDFQGYGFNLHAEKNKPGQYIGKIDEDSPAEKADLREHDRIIEVNGDNVEQEAHQNVIANIRSGGEETRLLVVDAKTDAYYKEKGIKIVGSMPQVLYITTPLRTLPVDIEEPEAEIITTNNDIIEEVNTVEPEPIPPMPEDDIPEEPTLPEPEVVEQSLNISENHDDELPDPSYEHSEPSYEHSEPRYEHSEPSYEHSESPVIDEEPTIISDDIISNDEPIVEPIVEHTINEYDDVTCTSNGTDYNNTAVSETITTETVTVTETVPEVQNGYPAPDVSTPEPEAPPAYNSVSAPSVQTESDGRPEGMSAREYLEHLKNKKKRDPRTDKVDFRTKYNMFQKM